MHLYRPHKSLVLFQACLFFLLPLFSSLQHSLDAKTKESTDTEKKQKKQKPKNPGDFLKNITEWVKDFPTRVSRPFKKGEEWDPDTLRQIVEESKSPSFTGNAANRLADSGIMMPLKQVGQGLIDRKVDIIKTFVANNALNVVNKSFDSRKGSQSIQQAVKVAESMTPAQRARLNSTFASLPGGDKLQATYPKIKAHVKNRALAHRNPALISVLSGLLNAGIYDGLDINGIKDKMIAPAAIMETRRMGENLVGGLGAGAIAREMDFVLDKGFEKIYAAALKSVKFGPTLSRMDSTIARLGKAIFKADRLGLKSGADAGGQLTKKLGLVGVGAGSRLTLKSVAKSLFKGAGFGIGLAFIADSFWDIACGLPNTAVIGGNRNRPVKRVEQRHNQFQKSGNKLKDWWTERRAALRNRVAGWRKWPFTKIIGSVGGFMGGTLGSVVAGALLIGGGPAVMFGGILVSALFAGLGGFVGSWLGSKLDRNKKFISIKKSLWAKGVHRRYNRMFIKSGLLPDSPASKRRIKELAKRRVEDISKLEAVGRPRMAIKLVRSLNDIKIVKQGSYYYFKVDKNHGGPLFFKATPYYDFIDAEGNQGIWDPTLKRVVNVGKVREHSGKSVIVLREQDIKISGDRILAKQKNLNFDYIESLGVFMQKIDGRWEITGMGATYDVFVAETGQRFEYKDGKLVRVVSKKEDKPSSLKKDPDKENIDKTDTPASYESPTAPRLFDKKDALLRQAFLKFKTVEKEYQEAVEAGDTGQMNELLIELKAAKEQYEGFEGASTSEQ
ncbi:hypothetical protein ACFL35_17660 [Candidatus Riflebacteria bacterium]